MSDEEKMTVFVTSGPDTPQRRATPFYMANIAAAMDNEAEMIFQIDGVLLMKKGVADNLMAKREENWSLTSYAKPKRQEWRCAYVRPLCNFMK